MVSYIALGSNIKDRERYLKEAARELEKQSKVLAFSSLYETEPVGYANQDWFLNAVVQIETKLTLQELLSFVLEIEQKLKRVRTIENGPRTIDLDILFYEDEILAKENLVVPHPRLHERAFVLVPLCEIAPQLTHPVVKKSVSNILEDLPQKEEVRLYKKDWL
ncbi:MAG: 2-amino-4-hydroxy-6-hydroxymethyldihydropteridine diphosphokinase [bacterium]|nr:2-amino-4-hydroxy-6-hydroxymethyldihydropteridine diphosphokinase [bacterium]